MLAEEDPTDLKISHDGSVHSFHTAASDPQNVKISYGETDNDYKRQMMAQYAIRDPALEFRKCAKEEVLRLCVHLCL